MCRTPRLPDLIEYRIKVFGTDLYTKTLLVSNFDKRFTPTLALTPQINTVSSLNFVGIGTLEKPFTVYDSTKLDITLVGS